MYILYTYTDLLLVGHAVMRIGFGGEHYRVFYALMENIDRLYIYQNIEIYK